MVQGATLHFAGRGAAAAMSWYDVLGLSGLCTQDQVEKAFMEKAKPYKDQSWDSMHFVEKKRVQELLDAFEVLGAGKSAQLLYQQFLCSKTIHGYAPVDPANAYKSTFDATDAENTTVMPVPTTEKNAKEMIRLGTMFHAYRMLGHALSRTATIETISRHYQQFQNDLTKLSQSAEERGKVQKLEGLPPSTDQAFWQARLRHARQAFKLLSEHREQYDQILERGSMLVTLKGWDSPWSDRLCVLSTTETLSALVLKSGETSLAEWKPFPAKAVKLKAVFKMPELPASVKAMEDDEEAEASTPTPAAAPAEPKKKSKKKRKASPPKDAAEKPSVKPSKKPKKKSAMDESRALAQERAKMKALNRSSGAQKNKAAERLMKKQGGVSPALSTSSSASCASTKKTKQKKKAKKAKKKKEDRSSSDYDLMALMATMNNAIGAQ